MKRWVPLDLNQEFGLVLYSVKFYIALILYNAPFFHLKDITTSKLLQALH